MERTNCPWPKPTSNKPSVYILLPRVPIRRFLYEKRDYGRNWTFYPMAAIQKLGTSMRPVTLVGVYHERRRPDHDQWLERFDSGGYYRTNNEFFYLECLLAGFYLRREAMHEADRSDWPLFRNWEPAWVWFSVRCRDIRVKLCSSLIGRWVDLPFIFGCVAMVKNLLFMYTR